jgi:hypothetical protein
MNAVIELTEDFQKLLMDDLIPVWGERHETRKEFMGVMLSEIAKCIEILRQSEERSVLVNELGEGKVFTKDDLIRLHNGLSEICREWEWEEARVYPYKTIEDLILKEDIAIGSAIFKARQGMLMGTVERLLWIANRMEAEERVFISESVVFPDCEDSPVSIATVRSIMNKYSDVYSEFNLRYTQQLKLEEQEKKWI